MQKPYLVKRLIIVVIIFTIFIPVNAVFGEKENSLNRGTLIRVYVDGSALQGGDGSDWTSPVLTIQEGIDKAHNNGAGNVWVKQGIYEESLFMYSYVKVYGGFKGNETVVGDRSTSPIFTVIDASKADGGSPADHVIYMEDTNSTRIDGFTITGGKADGLSPHDRGGGILLFSDDLSGDNNVIQNCLMKNNSSDYHGGGLFCDYNMSVKIYDSWITDNKSGNNGGVVFINEDCDSEIENCVFVKNEAVNNGGGLFTDEIDSIIQLTGCCFQNNSAEYGGGFYMGFVDELDIENCIFKENFAEWNGGGVYVRDSYDITFNNCTFKGNTAQDYGGGCYSTSSSPEFYRCKFFSNNSDIGGGIYFSSQFGSVSFQNTVFHGNYGESYGGGLYIYSDGFHMVNCTVSRNYTDNRGGGIFWTPYGDFDIRNTIFEGNNHYAIFEDENDALDFAIYNIEFCLFFNNPDGAHMYSDETSLTDQEMQGLKDSVYGNPCFVDPENGDLHITACSKAVDAGTSGSVPSVDVDINPRPVDVPGVGRGGADNSYDIGAFELQSGVNISVSPKSVNFGDHPVNQGPGEPKTVIFGNIGLDPVSVTNIRLTGSSDFSLIDPVSKLVLDACSTGSVSIVFDPSSLGIKAAVLKLETSDPDLSRVFVPIFGKGVNNAPVAGEEVKDFALSFNEINERVNITNFQDFPTSDITVSLWMNTTDVTRSGGIFSYALGGTGNDNEFLIYNQKNLTVYCKQSYISTGIAINDDSWHHVAVSWQNSDGFVCVYIDGDRVSTGTLASGLSLRSGGKLVFAEEQDCINPTGCYDPNQAYIGLLDEVRIWNYVRSKDQIRENMNYTLSGIEPGLAGYWNFNEQSGNTAFDTSGSGNHGTLENGPPRVSNNMFGGFLDNLHLNVSEDEDTVIKLSGSDEDDDPLTAWVVELPGGGSGEFYQYLEPGNRGDKIDSVPAEVTDSGMRVIYAPMDLSYPYKAAVHWGVYDGLEYSDNTATYTLHIQGYNDPPVIQNNTGITVSRLQSVFITPSELLVSDKDHLEAEIVYTVLQFPQQGVLKRNNTIMHSGINTFTQEQITQGLILYEHQGADLTPDSFLFTASDGMDAIDPGQFNITVVPANENAGIVLY